MSDQNVPIVKHISKIVSNNYPRVNKQHLIETSIQKSFTESYYPINNYESDNFLEFRIPASVGFFSDLSQIYLHFNLKALVQKKQSESTWTAPSTTTSGDWFDICNASGYTLFKHLSISLNGVQVINDPLNAYTSYFKLLTTFPLEDITKIGHLYHLEDYKSIKRVLNDSSYFTDLDDSDPIAIRLHKLRTYGVNIRVPLIADICQTSMFMLDGIQISIKLTLHNNEFIFFTAQDQPVITEADPKKYSYKLSKIKLDIQKYTPTENSYNALTKSLLPTNNITPTIDYLYTSKRIRQYHLSSNISEFLIDLPFNNSVPERIFLTFLKYDAFNTKDFKTNGLYLSHLDINNIFITLNGSTLFNVQSDFKNRNVS